MSSTLLEQTRAAHEEIERLERVIVRDLQQEMKTHKDRLHQSHRVKSWVETMMDSSGRLADIYDDKDQARKEEIVALGGQGLGGQTVFSAFYDRMKEYQDYLEEVVAYLQSFYTRTQPLQDIDKMIAKVEADFESRWNAGGVQGWEDRAVLRSSQQSQNGNAPPHDIDLNIYDTVDKLLEIRPERLKEALASLGLKVGGTPEERARRLLLTKATVESESDDEEQHIYNPLKLPMGWDGKPIPYWLYKLHGLGQEFQCEICGKYSYWGRRAFERHFKEWRHQHGMRCLGIPNTKNFHEITQIEDAKKLWEKIKANSGVNTWKPDVEEECEDGEGNVYNRKTYMELQRQGLV
ncbi:hypothetical protein CBR_g4095 [Chara braunii]|uniref:Matrin-type domain-containing protein n=1 Tax=Chara braunii TaxID=69332 RepID=A0A388KH80_CHABU|nr:hypothetical protein CBR_g4095 [Chara braunii]|eukprot:GBG69402.1 hypothetical protein CBR_g4095 [Chara braunii]